MPPACGFMAPSSPYVSAPSSESTPPTSQTVRASPTCPPLCARTLPGTRKMPEPMTVPTSSSVRSVWRSVRARGWDMRRYITPLRFLLGNARALGFRLLDDLRLQVRRHLVVVRELHVVPAAAAGHRRQLLLVTEHLRHRHLRLDD